MTPRVCLATDSLEPSGVGEHMLALGEASGAAASPWCSPVPPSAGGADPAAAGGRPRPGGQAARRDGSTDHLARWLRAGAPSTCCTVHAGIGWEGHGLAESRAAPPGMRRDRADGASSRRDHRPRSSAAPIVLGVDRPGRPGDLRLAMRQARAFAAPRASIPAGSYRRPERAPRAAPRGPAAP